MVVRVTSTETILALEALLFELRQVRSELTPYTEGGQIPSDWSRLASICSELDGLTDNMREAAMLAGPDIHHAKPSGDGWDGDGKPL
jgi:hypothetical protein